MGNQNLEVILEGYKEVKGIRELLEKYPYSRDVLIGCNYTIRALSIKPITKDISEGTGFSYDSGYNYYSNIIKIKDVFVEFFDIWHDEEDQDTEITFYIPGVQQC